MCVCLCVWKREGERERVKNTFVQDEKYGQELMEMLRPIQHFVPATDINKDHARLLFYTHTLCSSRSQAEFI